VRIVLVLMLGGAALSGCGGRFEQLAKCSADENPVPALGYETERSPTAPEQTLRDAIVDDCGPMRPVNPF